MAAKPGSEELAIDLAARAGWMYYLGGMTQDHIARELGISRQRAQRLVARAVADGLIGVRLNHPIAACLELERALKARFGLSLARVAPALPEGMDPVKSIAPVAAKEIERVLKNTDALVISLGTGRTLRQVVDEMPVLDLPKHKLVSLIGNAARDGSATVYQVIMRLADRIGARHYPLALPLNAESEADRDFHMGLRHVQTALKLARECDMAFVGIGDVSHTAPMIIDGFIDREEIDALLARGAVGEIVGWAFDGDGKYLEGGSNARINGVRADTAGTPVVCIAAGENKYKALAAALKGQLITGLITDETSALHLLA
ncbi:sugar-binding transcriptional regulator [Roseobacter sp. YSTF-M11]|uniref:Sugar-binding transcriptional regulator n=1 Tax=Roseobacter insulae TaxID=2859783 RepID=A0A9X1K2D6_9RHOB|nr:sugar-binding transcriptional regulator [Roseobacter insulae]MBW4710114.1 sugar-binding transcriptional regulator [Roseobacter insulae]